MRSVRPTQEQRILSAMADGAVLRPRDILRLGASATVISRLESQGKLQKLASPNGVLLGYRVPVGDAPEDGGRIVEIAIRHPNSVLCLMSALRHYNLTDDTEKPWVAAVPEGGNHKTRLDDLKIIHWRNPLFFTLGVQTLTINGTTVRITDPSRTVADMFRPSHKQIVEDIDKALATLARDYGTAAVTQAANYATDLGWGHRIARAAESAKEGLRWQGRPTR